jgi:hypothetical protein
MSAASARDLLKQRTDKTAEQTREKLARARRNCSPDE